MKRIFITVVAAATVACTLPATALARHHHKGHHHKGHAHKARILRFGSVSAASTDSSSPAAQSPSGTTAGKVASFENGVLKITLNNNTSVEGNVTPDTEFRCESEAAYGAGSNEQGSSGGGEQSSAASGQLVSQHADDLRAPIQNQGPSDCNDRTCGTEALVKDAPVEEAELKLTSAGAEWEKVEIGS